MARIALLGALVLLVDLPSFARADPPTEGRAGEKRALGKQQYDLADRAFRLGEFQVAIGHFREAYRLYPAPLLLWNLAQTYRQLGDHKQALFFYKQYLAADTTGIQHDAAQKRIKELEELVEKERTAKEAPPSGPTPPTALEAAPRSSRAYEPEKPTPVYRRWWLWTAVGGAVAVGLAVGLGVGLTRDHGGSSFDAGLGTFGPKALVIW